MDLRNATARPLVKVGNSAINVTSRLTKPQADVAVVTNDDGSDVLQAGVPIYVNSIGVATANAFMTVFLTALMQRLRSHRDFEAVQAFQNVFLRIHGDVLAENPEVREELEGLMEVQKKESERVMELLASSLGTLGFVRDVL